MDEEINLMMDPLQSIHFWSLELFLNIAKEFMYWNNILVYVAFVFSHDTGVACQAEFAIGIQTYTSGFSIMIIAV